MQSIADQVLLSRRRFFTGSAGGAGLAALAGLLDRDGLLATESTGTGTGAGARAGCWRLEAGAPCLEPEAWSLEPEA